MVTRAAKKQNVQFKIACTGTPVENTLADLWCTYDFIQPGLLGALNEFGKRYRRPIEAKTDQQKSMVEELRVIIKPQIMRRTKSEVAKDLPAKIENLDCQSLPISEHQRKLYAHAISIFKRRDNVDQSTSFTSHLGLIQYLRRLCSDPRQIGHQWCDNDDIEVILQASPKMLWLMRALNEIKQKDEKVIVFCEFRDLQRTLRHCISNRFSITPDIINGDTSASSSNANSRQKRLKIFQEKPGFGVIVLSPLAVGFGVNIQAANHVIHFTRPWNPAKEDQATDRAYRIGQTKDVYVYYPIITADDFITFDSKLDTLLKFKRELATDMLNGAGDISAADFGDLQDVGGASLFANEDIDDENLCSMQPDTFEAFCALLWSKMGYKSYKTPHSGDQGIDMVAINGNQGVLMQCKTSIEKGKRLPYNSVYEVVGGKVSYAQKHPGVDFSMSVATNQFFNPTAKNQAELHDVELYDRSILSDLLKKYPVKHLELEEFMSVFGMIC
jgi:SNF2 family DNA or RNA helicase